VRDALPREADLAAHADRIRQTLAEELPHECRGYPTNYTEPDPSDQGVQHMKPITTAR